MDKHTKPYRCNVGNCESGFTTSNDLSRHKASVHEMGNARYICQEGECRYRKFNKKTDDPAKKKHFVRKDNYMNHCRRMHQELDENILAKK